MNRVHLLILRCYRRGKRETIMMQCPNCKSRSLKVDVTFTGTIDIEVSEDGEFEVMDSEPGDSEWTDDSCVYCYECQHESTVLEAKQAWQKTTAPDKEASSDDPS